MIQHFLAQLQLQAQPKNNDMNDNNDNNTNDDVKVEAKANDQKERQQSNQSQSTQATHLDTPFKLPMQYLPDDQLCAIDKSVLSDLELIECTKPVNNTNNSANDNTATESRPMYAHVFQPQSAFAKRYLGMWAKQFTTSVPHLQDMQRFIASVSKTQDPTNDSDHDHDRIEAIWTRIKTDAAFRDKFNYIDYAPLDMLNRSPAFLQCYSMYNLFSPLLSFLMPVIMLIVPFFLLKLQGVPISMPTYFGIIKMMLSQHAVGKLIFDMSSVSWDKRIYILVSVVFYVVQMYQNVVSCHRFYRNTFLVHDDLTAIRAYAEATIKKMCAFAGHALTCGGTFGPFLSDLQKNREQLERMVAALDRIDAPALTAKKCLQIGYVMQQYYAVFSDAGIAACMQYSFGFNAFAEHMAQFGALIASNKVAACDFVSKSRTADAEDADAEDKKKKDKKKNKDKKKKEEANCTTIVNGYYVATALNDDSSALGPVKNTVSLDKRLVITGPNASGKTTILKMTMLNILFSQQLGYGFYEAGTRIRPYHQLHSYLNIPDTSGRDSLFQAESRRCKEILDKLTEGQQATTGSSTGGGQSPPVRHFCIFDELYSGTNPYEAIASAYGYIMHLAKHDSVDFMLTTHYIQLCKLFQQDESKSESDKREKIANKAPSGTTTSENSNSNSNSNSNYGTNKIQNLHMEVADRGNYDFNYLYTLRPGISSIKGGIKVLYDLQYPASIVDATRRILSTL
jgi:energy-coupling factor transporter ATP-binding protein EcfA2